MRGVLKAKIYSEHQRHGKVICPWCKKPSTVRDDMHEALVKRNAVLDNEKIMVPENCVFMHRRCHDLYGQTRQCRIECQEYLVGLFGLQRINAFLKEFDMWIDGEGPPMDEAVARAFALLVVGIGIFIWFVVLGGF